MRAEMLRHRWAALWMAAAILATGCATLPHTGEPHSSAKMLREGSATEARSTQPHSVATTREKRSRVRLRRRHGAAVPSSRGSLSCGGQAVPEGWPNYSSQWDDELLAPFFLCTSPAEFLALQIPMETHAKTGHTGGFSGDR